MAVPAIVSFFIGAVCFAAFRFAKWSRADLWTHFKAAWSDDWEADNNSLRRLEKHTARFRPYAFITSAVLTLFYLILGVIDGDFACLQTLNSNSLLDRTFPWDDKLLDQPEKFEQWVFILAFGTLYVGAVNFWYKTKADTHSQRARRIYMGMLTIVKVGSMQDTRFAVLVTWKAAALGSRNDILRRRQRTHTAHARMGLVWVLRLVVSAVFATPTLLFTIAQNVETLPAVFEPFREVWVVVVCNNLLKAFVLPRATYYLTTMEMTETIEDANRFNRARVNTLFVISLCTDLSLIHISEPTRPY
eukprot:TRINITY_DN39812_c0_g1_i1.p1 TRINITY_DN39812_c0_g1~~TRINITY_DN39812_c0_g1_i1.p1  ORF type:complete len:303 (+),score=46.11 TRINITY_DN39812_c0_g1_i1:723-1631(+)